MLLSILCLVAAEVVEEAVVVVLGWVSIA